MPSRGKRPAHRKAAGRKHATRARTFADFEGQASEWVTLASGEYYPDTLAHACQLYRPVLARFKSLLYQANTSIDLFRRICAEDVGADRVQMARVFKRYVSPDLPVEMLKKKKSVDSICDQFGNRFRPLQKVKKAFASRRLPDEALCALLWEYKDRGRKGYDLTEQMFRELHSRFPKLVHKGPERAGRDILLGDIFENYPKPDRPVDFVIYKRDAVLAVGLARYDSDRGGAQEDDRTGQYRDCAQEILGYAKKRRLQTKVVFLNDGPGLLLGSMWRDYADLEARWPGRVRVVTLKMIPTRITAAWLNG